MADIRRETGDVNPNTYIRPGVVDNSASTILGGLAEGAIKLDTSLAQQKFYDEMENLRAEREIGAPSVIAKQEAAQQQGLSPMDGQATAGLQQSMGKDIAAYRQGRMTHDQMMLRAERTLRKAIASRPGLAQEFRGIAQQVLGRDVVGAGLDQLAADDAELMTAATKAAKDEAEKRDALTKLRREELGRIMPTGNLTTAAEVEQAYAEHFPELQEVTRLKATAEMAAQHKTTFEAGQTLRGPQATADFVGWSATQRLEMLQSVTNAQAVFENPAVAPEQRAEVVAALRNGLGTFISNANARVASGDVDPVVAGREIEVFQKMQTDMEELLTGEMSNEVRETQIKGLLGLAKQAMMTSSADMPAYVAAVELLGSPMVAQAMAQPGMQFNKLLPVAIGRVALNIDAQKATTALAGDMVSSTAPSFGEASQATDATLTQTMGLYTQVAQRFITVPDAEFNIRNFVGTQGFVHKLHLHRQSIAKKASPGDAGTLGGMLAAAAYNAQRVLTKGLLQKSPSLRDKIEVKVAPDGKLFHVKSGKSLTGPEQAVLLEYNQEWGGRKILDTIGVLIGAGDGAEGRLKAAELVYKGAEGAGTLRSRTQTPRSGGGSGSTGRASQSVRGPSTRWWE